MRCYNLFILFEYVNVKNYLSWKWTQGRDGTFVLCLRYQHSISVCLCGLVREAHIFLGQVFCIKKSTVSYLKPLKMCAGGFRIFRHIVFFEYCLKNPVRIEHWFKSDFANKGIQVSLSFAATDLGKTCSFRALYILESSRAPQLCSSSISECGWWKFGYPF